MLGILVPHPLHTFWLRLWLLSSHTHYRHLLNSKMRLYLCVMAYQNQNIAGGVQEQAQDALVPPLLGNCLTECFHPVQYSGPCNSVNYVAHSKNVSWWWRWWKQNCTVQSFDMFSLIFVPPFIYMTIKLHITDKTFIQRKKNHQQAYW